MPAPGVERLDHRGAEEPNDQPNVEVQLVRGPGLSFATSVVSRGEDGVDNNEGEICGDSEEHDHVERPRYAANRVDSLYVGSSCHTDPGQEASEEHDQFEDSLFGLGISLIAANYVTWASCVSSS